MSSDGSKNLLSAHSANLSPASIGGGNANGVMSNFFKSGGPVKPMNMNMPLIQPQGRAPAGVR